MNKNSIEINISNERKEPLLRMPLIASKQIKEPQPNLNSNIFRKAQLTMGNWSREHRKKDSIELELKELASVNGFQSSYLKKPKKPTGFKSLDKTLSSLKDKKSAIKFSAIHSPTPKIKIYENEYYEMSTYRNYKYTKMEMILNKIPHLNPEHVEGQKNMRSNTKLESIVKAIKLRESDERISSYKRNFLEKITNYHKNVLETRQYDLERRKMNLKVLDKKAKDIVNSNASKKWVSPLQKYLTASPKHNYQSEREPYTYETCSSEDEFDGNNRGDKEIVCKSSILTIVKKFNYLLSKSEDLEALKREEGQGRAHGRSENDDPFQIIFTHGSSDSYRDPFAKNQMPENLELQKTDSNKEQQSSILKDEGDNPLSSRGNSLGKVLTFSRENLYKEPEELVKKSIEDSQRRHFKTEKGVYLTVFLKYEHFFHRKHPTILKHILMAFGIHSRRDFQIPFRNFAKFYKILIYEEASKADTVDFFLKFISFGRLESICKEIFLGLLKILTYPFETNENGEEEGSKENSSLFSRVCESFYLYGIISENSSEFDVNSCKNAFFDSQLDIGYFVKLIKENEIR